jgi:hypothetical protein
MISNELRSPYTRQPYGHQGSPAYAQQQPRQPVQEDTLKSEQIQVERKTFNLTLKENRQGRFLRISEENGTKRNAIILPAPGLAEFKEVVDAMLKASAEIPVKSQAVGA